MNLLGAEYTGVKLLGAEYTGVKLLGPKYTGMKLSGVKYNHFTTEKQRKLSGYLQQSGQKIVNAFFPPEFLVKYGSSPCSRVGK